MKTFALFLLLAASCAARQVTFVNDTQSTLMARLSNTGTSNTGFMMDLFANDNRVVEIPDDYVWYEILRVTRGTTNAYTSIVATNSLPSAKQNVVVRVANSQFSAGSYDYFEHEYGDDNDAQYATFLQGFFSGCVLLLAAYIWKLFRSSAGGVE